GSGRHVGVKRTALARRVLSRARSLDDRVPAPARLGTGARLSGRAGRRRLLPSLRRGAPATARRVLAALRGPGHGVPQHVTARPSAADAGRVAPARASPNRGLALV